MDNVWYRFLGKIAFPRFVSEEWPSSVDIFKPKDTLLVWTELPGLDVKDINDTIYGDILAIKGDAL